MANEEGRSCFALDDKQDLLRAIREEVCEEVCIA
jgi:hypothetical protein